jgi:excisionase family DNA binding protein
VDYLDLAGQVLFSPVDAAEKLGVSRSKVYQPMASRELVSVRIGHLRRIPAGKLRRFIERLLCEQAYDGGA